MENTYAQALWTVIERGMNQADAVRALHSKLKSEGREALLPRIAKAFERLGAAMDNRTAVTLTVADKAHEHSALAAAEGAIAKIGIEKKDVVLRVDHSLIGGWRLEGREALIDESYKKHLLAVFSAATRS